MKTTCLSASDTAKLIRAALKRAFPGVKFSVRSKTYSGGASIDVGWTDGPTSKWVEAVAKQFQGGGFDGMIDLKYHKDHWLLPDGTTCVASCEGTEGSAGTVPAARNWMPHPEAKLVSFGADYVFCTRRLSPAFAERVLAKARAKFADADKAQVKVCGYSGDAWIDTAGCKADHLIRQFVSSFAQVRAAN